jgi:transposase
VKRFVEGQERGQLFLLPECLDDYVTENNPVRVIEAFIDELDLATLAIDGVVPETTGRPAYHPATLLKIYLYGYLNRIASSRRLERETQRNIELMWLTGRLMPDFKTIADFRKDNGPAIRATCRQIVVLCRRLDLFCETVIAIDGSRFKAVNTRDKNYTHGAFQRRMEQVEASIARYLAALDTADRQVGEVAEAESIRLKDKLARLKQQMRHLREMEIAVQAASDRQISLTDPDARAMATSGKGTGIVGYNVQTAVDVEHHLIVAHEVTNAKDTDIKQRQARPLHAAGLRLPRRKGPLHLPGRRTPDERACPIGPPRRHRPVPPSDRLLHLSSQAQVYAGQAKADQALETRTCPRRNASQARSDARRHERAPADRRASVRDHQGLDGLYPLFDPHLEAGQHRNEPPHPGL